MVPRARQVPAAQNENLQGDERSTIASPCGGNISLFQQPTGDWAAEQKAIGSAITATGYFDNDWHKMTLHVACLTQNSTNTTLQFKTYTPHGICEALDDSAANNHGLVQHCGGPAPGRFVVTGLLSEVDTPGEYIYKEGQLFIFPPPDPDGDGVWSAQELASPAAKLGEWGGPGLISFRGSSWATLRDVTVSGVGGGSIVGISGGQHVTLGGCKFCNSAGTGISLSGVNHTIIGNDLLDIGGKHCSSDPARAMFWVTSTRSCRTI